MEKNIAVLLQLEHECRSCETYEELKYLIVNETKKLIDYEHAIFLEPNLNDKLEVETISDLSVVDSTSMFVQNIENISNSILKKENIDELLFINDKLDEFYKKELGEYSKLSIYLLPIKIKREEIEIVSYLLLFRKESLSSKHMQLLKHLSLSFAHCIFAFRKSSLKTKIKNSFIKSKYFKYIAILLIVLMFIPVKLTILAPLEVVPKDPFIVTSPLDGAIESIKVKPNQQIKINDLLVKLDDTEFVNKYLIAERSLNVVEAQLFTAKQSSFYYAEQKNMIAQLEKQVKLKRTELEYAKSQLDKTKIYAKKDGIAIIQNPNEWSGKPVITGERILQVANKESVELKIMLPVNESIFIKDDAKVKAFFDNDPLNSWSAEVTNITYKPEITPEGDLVYKINADFDSSSNKDDTKYSPTVGLRGTAKIYSKEVTLFFYLFRKPITSLRQFIGW